MGNTFGNLTVADQVNNNEDHMDCDKKNYSPYIASYVRMLYVIYMIIWTGIIIWFELYITDIVGWLVLFIPYIIFAFGFCNAECLCREVENHMYRNNYLTIGLIIVLPLLTWISKDYKGATLRETKRFKAFVVLAIILIILSMLDIWVPRNWLSVHKHGKSALQTLALTLLVFAFYNYYIMCPEPGLFQETSKDRLDNMNYGRFMSQKF